MEVNSDRRDMIANAVALTQDLIRCPSVTPADAGLPAATLADIVGGDREHNAAALRALLQGQPSAYRDIVVLGSAAALIVAGKADGLEPAARMAEQSIDKGAARAALEKLVDCSNR